MAQRNKTKRAEEWKHVMLAHAEDVNVLNHYHLPMLLVEQRLIDKRLDRRATVVIPGRIVEHGLRAPPRRRRREGWADRWAR